MFYKNTNFKVRSPDGDTDFFDIVAGVLQGYLLAPYLFVICLDYVLRTSIDLIKEDGFMRKKARSRRYPAETITEAGYADDLALLANIAALAKSLPHNREQKAGGIGPQVNADKTKSMCFKRDEAFFTLSGMPLKLVDKFIYLGNSISSTECDVHIRITKAYTVNDRILIIRKSCLSDKINRDFFPAVVVSILQYRCTTLTLAKKKKRVKRLDTNNTRILRAFLNKSWNQQATKQRLYGHLTPI